MTKLNNEQSLAVYECIKDLKIKGSFNISSDTMEILLSVLDEILKNVKLCPKCGKNPAQEPHYCPYDVEINNDYSLCECCDDCEWECNSDI